MNEDFKGVSQKNFKDWIFPYMSKLGMTQEQFLEGVSSDFYRNVFEPNRNFFFSNNDFHQVIENVQTFFEREMEGIYSIDNINARLENLGEESGGVKDFALSFLFPILNSSGSLFKSSLFAGGYASMTTRVRRVDSFLESELENLDYRVGLRFSNLPGIRAKENVLRYNAGKCYRVRTSPNKTVNDYNPEFNYDPESGNATIIATAKKKKGEIFFDSWSENFANLPKWKRRILGNLDKAFFQTTARQETLENILNQFGMMQRKDLENLKGFDKTTYHHNIAVSDLALLFAKSLNFPSREVMALAYGSIKHDKGKAKVPQSIIRSKGKLTQEQFLIIQGHADQGCYDDLKFSLAMLKRLEKEKGPQIKDLFGSKFKQVIFSRLERTIVDGALLLDQHQEFYNGGGYGLGFKEGEITLSGLLIKVLDDFDAMSRVRSYKPEFTKEKMFNIAKENLENGHYHPELGAFVIETMEKLYSQGYSHQMYSREYQTAEIGRNISLDSKFTAFTKGNIDLDFGINVPEKIQKLVSNYTSKEYYAEELLDKIEGRYVGFFPEIKYNEFSRLFEEGVKLGGIAPTRENVKLSNKLKEIGGRIYDVHKLSRSDLSFLDEHFKNQSNVQFKYQEYIENLEECMDPVLIEYAKQPITSNHKFETYEAQRRTNVRIVPSSSSLETKISS
jgi:HD-GYP domain-containing protein (c-di-GMP phosphodiesterase class II)